MTSIAARYDACLFDLDGVLYRGTSVIPNAPPTLEELRRLTRRVLFITNNSSKTPDEVAAMLRSFAIRAEGQEVLTSALATAALLRREGYEGKTAFVVGEKGVRRALAEAGVEVLEGTPDKADLVVVGWDRSVDYEKVRVASLLIQRGARLVATNADASYPAPDGLWPGAGAILAAITTTTGARPTVVGKPARPMLDAAAEVTAARHPLLIGDRLDTDIAAAFTMHWDSALVLTGAATPPDLLSSAVLPTYVGQDVSVLLEDVPPARFRTADESDLPSLRALLEQADLGSDGLRDRLPSTVVSYDGRDPVATACVEKAGGYGILRSVAVRTGARGKGIGMLAVASAIGQARQLGFRDVFLFTQSAAPFFARLGFMEVERADLPAPIRESDQATKECPVSAIPMVLARQSASTRHYQGQPSS